MRWFARFAFVVALAGAAVAQTPPSEDALQSERRAAFAAAEKVAVRGASIVKLRDQGQIALPGGYLYVPQPEAGRVMRALGNAESPTLIGLVFPQGEGHWFATLRFIAEGYIRDDDARNWNADELLRNLKDGTEAGNAERKARGFEPLEVVRWLEPPAYDSLDRHLVWSALVRGKGVESDTGSANYNTYALGREGYFSLNLVTAVESLATHKPQARELLAALSYMPGKRYEDFNPATDQVAAYGVAALVGGVAAKKLGAFALIAAFLLKFWKVIAVGAMGAAYGVNRWLGRRARTDA